MRIAHVIVALMFSLSTAATAAAQLCGGRPSFSHYAWQASLGVPFSKEGTVSGLTTSVGGGRDALFVLGIAKILHSTHSGDNSYSFGANAGSDVAVSERAHLHLCPMFTGIRTWGPDVLSSRRVTLADVSTVSLAGGATAAVFLKDTATQQFGPVFGLHLLRDHTKIIEVDGGLTFNQTITFGVIEAGAAFVFSDHAAITSVVSIPVRNDAADVVLLVQSTFSFGLK